MAILNFVRASLALAALASACSPVDLVLFGPSQPSGTGGLPVAATAGAAGTVLMGGAGGDGARTTLVDDFEDGNSRGIGDAGWWYLVNDGTGTQTIAVADSASIVPNSASERGSALRITIEGFTKWGAAVGVGIGMLDLGTNAVELSFYVVANRPIDMSVHVLDSTDSHFTTNFSVSTSWQKVVVRLDKLFIVDGSGVRSIDLSTVHELQWFLTDGGAAEVWLDQVEIRSF